MTASYPLSKSDKAFRKAHIRHSAYTRDWDAWRRNMGKQEYPPTISRYINHMLYENGRDQCDISEASYVKSS